MEEKIKHFLLSIRIWITWKIFMFLSYITPSVSNLLWGDIYEKMELECKLGKPPSPTEYQDWVDNYFLPALEKLKPGQKLYLVDPMYEEFSYHGVKRSKIVMDSGYRRFLILRRGMPEDYPTILPEVLEFMISLPITLSDLVKIKEFEIWND